MEKVIFNEAEHSYTAENSRKRYTSCTQLISKFKQPFDKEKISKAYAAKHGGTAKGWQDKWAKISKEACDKGTAFHVKKENEILESIGKTHTELVQHPSPSPEHLPQESYKRVTQLEFDSILDGIYTEVVLYNHYFEIAGQVDVVTFDKEFFDIDDHKTSRVINRYSFRHPRTGYKQMKAPLQKLMDANYWHYALQINLYAFMIEQLTGKKARNLQFTHYPPDVFEDDGISKEGVVYKVPYMREEVLAMLKEFSKKDISQFK